MGSESDVKSGTGSRHKVRVGVFIPLGCQLLDAACVDIFGTMGYDYMSKLGSLVPATVLNLTPEVSIYYIGTVPANTPIELTSAMNITCTHHLSAPEVQPGQLDIVLIPGPDPSVVVDDESKNWLAGHAAVATTDILSVCTGAYICGAAGIIEGKKFCGPRGVQDDLQSRFKELRVGWVGNELRWVRDGNIWSSGGVTNGNDLVAAYARQQSHHFPGPVAEIAIAFTETGDRPQKYTTGKTAFTFGIVWQVVKAVFLGLGGKTNCA